MKKYFVGLDCSDITVAICVVDGAGVVVHRATVEHKAKVIATELKPYRKSIERIGHEAGGRSAQLQKDLTRLKLPVVCIDARHAHATLAAQRDKTDESDAYGIAQLVGTGWYKAVHIKSDDAYRLRLLVVTRRSLLRKAIDIENALRGMLKHFGLSEGKVGRRAFGPLVKRIAKRNADVAFLAGSLLKVRDVVFAEIEGLNKIIAKTASEDAVCKRLMTVPGVGPLTAVTFRGTIDDPARFSRSRCLGAYLGLTPRRHQSGQIDVNLGISKRGDRMLRTLLVNCASSLLLRGGQNYLRLWAQRLRARRPFKPTCVAIARRLAVLLHRMWVEGTTFRAGLAQI